ncbi:MAG: peptidylprolyl isomerase, partial [Calditrichia bacterium]|nr:peptidylprolyl isomerase [Calditrichia bacterium]
LQALTPIHLSEKNSNNFQKKFVKSWVNEKILSVYFEKNKIQLSKKDLSMIEKYKYELLHSHFINSIATEVPKPTDVEITQFYEEHKSEFMRDEDEVHLVLLYLEQSNIGIQDDIKHSTSLIEVIDKNFLADKISNQMEINGDLGYVRVSKLKKEIFKAVKRYKSGKISRRIKTKEGYYYIQVLDYQKKDSYKELSLVKDIIIHHIANKKFSKFIDDIVQQESQNLIIDRFFDKIN